MNFTAAGHRIFYVITDASTQSEAAKLGKTPLARIVSWAQAGVDPARYLGLDFERFYLQPMDGPDREGATRAAVAYCLSHARWRLSVQTHKYLGIP